MMLDQKEHLKYSRHLQLPEVGESGQMKLKKASVLVAGAGGLGCPVLQYLVAAGVGNIHIVDGDLVEESNLHRQLLYAESDIGRLKAEVAAERLRKQNSLVNVHVHATRLTTENIEELFRCAEIIVDCTDNFSSRYLISDACALLRKTVVYGAVDRFQGQVSVFHLHSEAPSYRCLFPERSATKEIQNCSESGVLGVLPGIIGLFQATEVMKIICGIGEVLTGKLLLFDALTMQTMQIALTRNPQINDEMPSSISELQQWDYEQQCGLHMNSISVSELSKALEDDEDFVFIDVRGEKELPEIQSLTGYRIPLPELEDRVGTIDRSANIVLYCKSGLRSAKALQLLTEKHGFTKCRQLIGGVEAWINYHKKK